MSQVMLNIDYRSSTVDELVHNAQTNHIPPVAIGKITALDRVQSTDKSEHVLIKDKDNTDALQTIIDQLDQLKELKGSTNTASIKLPPGLLLMYTLRGSSLATCAESEDEYIETIKNALPKDVRSLWAKLRSEVEKELDRCSTKVFGTIRFVSEQNIKQVSEIFERARETGLGRHRISIQGIINGIWNNREEINKNAIRLEIATRITDIEDLKRYIKIETFMIDSTFSDESLSPETLDAVRDLAKEQVITELENNLVKDLNDSVGILSKSIHKLDTKKNVTLHGKSAKTILRQVDVIKNLNVTNNEKVDSVLGAVEGLTLRNIELSHPEQDKKSKPVKKKNHTLAPKKQESKWKQHTDVFGAATETSLKYA